MDLGTTVTREGAIYTPLEPPCWLVDLGLVLSFYKKWFKTIYWIMNLFTNMMRKSLHKFDHLAQKAEPTLRSKKKWTLGPISCCTAVPALRAIYQRDVRRITRGLAIASSELASLLNKIRMRSFLTNRNLTKILSEKNLIWQIEILSDKQKSYLTNRKIIWQTEIQNDRKEFTWQTICFPLSSGLTRTWVDCSDGFVFVKSQ